MKTEVAEMWKQMEANNSSLEKQSLRLSEATTKQTYSGSLVSDTEVKAAVQRLSHESKDKSNPKTGMFRGKWQFHTV